AVRLRRLQLLGSYRLDAHAVELVEHFQQRRTGHLVAHRGAGGEGAGSAAKVGGTERRIRVALRLADVAREARVKRAAVNHVRRAQRNVVGRTARWRGRADEDRRLHRAGTIDDVDLPL